MAVLFKTFLVRKGGYFYGMFDLFCVYAYVCVLSVCISYFFTFCFFVTPGPHLYILLRLVYFLLYSPKERKKN